MLLIRNERPDDGASVETLLDAAFGPDRHAKISYRYRGHIPRVSELCLVAEEAGRLVGTIRYWPVRLDHEPALLLGPVATDPTRRAVGIGRALVFESLARAADLGWDLVFLVGDRDYYRRFGFEVVPPSIVMPGEDPGRLQWRCLGGGPRASAAGELRRYDGSRVETGPRMEGHERPPPA
jgi:predicted N-acetyltransferase YhbS